MSKEERNSNSFLIAFIMLILGAMAMYIGYPYIMDSKYAENDAKVSKINGLYVFIESEPICSDCYDVIGEMKGESVVDMANSVGIGKEKWTKVVNNIFNKSREKLTLSEQLREMTELVKEKYSNANGIIMRGKFNRCEVIKLKK